MALRLLPVVLGVLLGACAAGSLDGEASGGTPGDGSDPSPVYGGPADSGGDVPPGDGTDCGECPAPGECRMGVCIEPEEGGPVCEFDPECGDGALCIAGRCTPDPRDGGCGTTADCPVGFTCRSGLCDPTPDGGCAADAECPDGSLCEGGMCVTDAACDIAHPDLAGEWQLDSVLRLREALPDWLGGFLAAVAGPFHYLAGHTMDLGTGLPGWVEAIIGPVIRDWAASHLPPWALELLGGIADLSDILSTWTIDETMYLEPGAGRDLYRGSHVWNAVEFTYRGRVVRGAPEDIVDFRFVPSDFEAAAVCGIFSIERHDVEVSIGAVIAWLVNTIVYEASDGRYRTLDDALRTLSSGFCSAAGDAAASAVDFPGVDVAVESACSAELGRLSTMLVDAVRNARLGLDVMTLKGSAPIAGPRSLRPGTWEGTLAGGDFTGDFTAVR